MGLGLTSCPRERQTDTERTSEMVATEKARKELNNSGSDSASAF